MKTNTIFNRTKKRAAEAIFATAAMLILTAATAAGQEGSTICLAAALVLSVGAGVFVLLDIAMGKLTTIFWWMLAPAAALVALENYTHVITDLSVMILVLNLLFFYILYSLGAFLTGSVKIGFAAATLVPMLFGIANYFVVAFRGTPIVPWDFLSVKTAMSVADNYTFTLEWKQTFSLMAFIWIILISSKSCVRFKKPGRRICLAVLFAALLGGYVQEIQNSAVQKFFGMDTTLFTLNVLYRNNGIAAAFLGNLRFLQLEKPDGYSKEAVEAIEERVKTEEETADTLPNVIVIMNEAFSDLSVWGDFATSEEVMPYFKMLQQEGIGGEVYVSVKGGNTANTEFEFLTGDTMAFLPTGSVPYQQYINDALPTIPSYLKTLGYSTLAIHPYNASGWDRDKVYEYFGFDEFLSSKSFDNPHRMRGYVSDRAAFDKIIEQYELKGEGDKLFCFEVTMQNHGGYSKPSPDFESYIKLPEVEDKTTSVLATEKYLTLMNESDRALGELVEYFREQEEPTVILMFGDHQPSDYITNVIQRICGAKNEETLESAQTGYRVPFLIWSNYGLEHTYYEGISVNYLGGILMDAAGIPKTGYQTYLGGLMEQLPVISGLVCRDSQGKFFSLSDDTHADLLNEYKMLQYNHLVDVKNRSTAFFGS